MALGVLAGIFVVLFIGAFFSKRRFGLLGLAITAGYVLSSLWSTDAGYIIAATGVVPNGPLVQTIAQAAVVLLPALVLLFHGYTYKSKVLRCIGSLLFAGLAIVYLIEPLNHSLVFDAVGQSIYGWIVVQKGLLVSAGVVLAVLDIFLTKPAPNIAAGKKGR